MSSLFSYSSHGSRPQMSRYRTGNDGVYYDNEGRVYYKGKDVNEEKTSPQLSYNHYHSNARNGDARQYNARPPPRSTSGYDERRAPRSNEPYPQTGPPIVDNNFERDLTSKGYRVVREEVYDPHTGKKEVYGNSEDRYRTRDRYDDRDKHSNDGSRAYSHSSRPLPTLPREANRRDHSRGEWHEMNGYSHTLPRNTKDKDFLFESESNDRRQSQDNKMYYVPFIIFGVFLVICGVMNLLFCEDFQYYFRFWVGILILEAGVFGAIHRGHYRSGWRNILFIGACFVATAASLIGFALSMRHLIPETKLMASAHNTSEYVRHNAPDDTYSGVKNDDVVVWVCYVFDWAAVIFLIASFTALSVGAVVLDRYWNTNYYYTQVAEPFCHPPLFNPFGQMQVGVVVAMMGIVTVYGCTDSNYMDYWSPVWAGGVSILAGLIAAIAMKRHDLQIWSIVSFLTELLAAMATVSAVVLCTLGLVKNISATNKKQSNFEEDSSVASATLFAITIALCLINIFFCFAQMVRMVTYLCAPSQTRRRRLSGAASGRSFSEIGYPHNSSAAYRTNAPGYHHNAGYEHSRTVDRLGYSHQNGREQFARY